MDRAISTAVEGNKKRCEDEISQWHNDSIGETRKRKQPRLQKEKDHQNQDKELIASLIIQGKLDWDKLSHKDKWEKENVLAVFQSGVIPYGLYENDDNWNWLVPEPLRNDRDILLARLNQKGFARNYFNFGRPWSPPFRVPQQLINDKEVVATLVRVYPEVLMQDILPQELLDDADVFLAYVRSDRIINSSEEKRDQVENLLNKFSVRLRSNAELMLTAAKNMSSDNIFNLSSDDLTDDCDFAMRLVETVETVGWDVPKHALSSFSDRIQASHTVVLHFVKKNGLCLKDASKTLRGCKEIVRAACGRNAAALLYCAPGRTKRQLCSNKRFMMNIFSRIHPSTNEKGYPKLYQMLSPILKYDPECVAAAHKAKSLLIADLPSEIAYDHGFWLDLVEWDSSFWRALPDQFKDDAAFVYIMGEFEDKELIGEVLSRIPFLAADRVIWTKIIDHFEDCYECYEYDNDTLLPIISKYAAEQIRLDEDLMFRACLCDYKVMEALSPQFQKDKRFVEAVLEDSPYSLSSIPHAVQCLYPEMVVKVILQFAEYDCRPEEFEDAIASDLWTNLDIAKAWFETGGYYHSSFPATLEDDKQFGLLVAKHSPIDDFEDATSEALRCDKAFMMEAVKVDTMLHDCCLGPLRKDFDLAVLAFSGSDSKYLRVFTTESTNDEVLFLHSVFEQAREKVEAHDGFTNGFLPGLSDHCGSRCHLPMLLSGEETLLSFKKKVAEYLCVPTGKELKLLRQAMKNLESLPTSTPS